MPARMHSRDDYRVPDEAETWPGKLLCLLWGAVFAPALLCDVNDRLYNERWSGYHAGVAQLLTLIFWAAFIICEVVGETEQRAWVLAGLLLPALLLQGLLYALRPRLPIWNREEAYLFPPATLPQPVTEETAQACAARMLPPLCCREEEMHLSHSCLHTGDVPGLPRSSLFPGAGLYVEISFRRAPVGWKHWLTQDMLCLFLPFLWVLSLLCLMLSIPLAVYAHCLGLVVLFILISSPLKGWWMRFPLDSGLGTALSFVYAGAMWVGAVWMLGHVLFYYVR